MELPRVYTTLDDRAFDTLIERVFSNSAEAACLDEPLLPEQDTTIRQYIRQHLPYTLYLLSRIFENG